jgi:hypothetical protein
MEVSVTVPDDRAVGNRSRKHPPIRHQIVMSFDLALPASVSSTGRTMATFDRFDSLNFDQASAGRGEWWFMAKDVWITC